MRARRFILPTVKILTMCLALQACCVFVSRAQCIAEVPDNFQIESYNGCEVTLNWSPVENISYYMVRYRTANNNQWEQLFNAGTDTSFVITGLLSDNKYVFGVSSYCGLSGIFSKTRTTQVNEFPCEAPQITEADYLTAGAIHIAWQPCGASSYNRFRYREINSSEWTVLFLGTANDVTLSMSDYAEIIYQASACPDSTKGWTAPDTLLPYTIGPLGYQPNVILILLDDARYDSYSCNGAPIGIETPNIDRIANEGVNFKNSFAVYSLCNPSRASILTGLYPHHHGAMDNQTMFDENGFITVAEALNSAGYYTAYLGKFMNAIDSNPVPQPGWDYWMCRKGSHHIDANYNCNGVVQNISGHLSDVITDTVLQIISESQEPFFITMGFSAPHQPYTARPQDSSLYDNLGFNYPENYEEFNENYPSFLYSQGVVADDSSSILNTMEAYYEMMESVEYNVGRVLDYLDQLGITDSTLIIFMSDNGYMQGEHFLKGKRLPYEESIRIPLFIRFPDWFTPYSVVNGDIALNVDIAPTILEAANLSEPITDGISLRNLFQQTQDRTAFYYEVTKAPSDYASCRSVRTMIAKYTYYFCDSITEEFFNLVDDPGETDNLINSSSYQTVIQYYRDLMDSFKIALGDTITEQIDSCFLSNEFFLRAMNLPEQFDLYPNPATDEIHFTVPSSEKTSLVQVFSASGTMVEQTNIDAGEARTVFISLDQLPAGMYFLQLKNEQEIYFSKFIVVH